MLTSDWQLKTPLDAIIFDCDGTLSQMEGIDELAVLNHVAESVKKLTQHAMTRTGLTPQLYEERLKLAQPRVEQMNIIGEEYIKKITEDMADVIALYQRLEKKIYIVSAGLLPSILPLARFLNIPKERVFAVGIFFDRNGHYLDFERTSKLTHNKGKEDIVNQIIQSSPRAAYTGDGLNDCPVAPLVTRFVGFGGVYFRENIAARCEYYITTPSMSPFLPLTLTSHEQHQLTSTEKRLYIKGLDALNQGGVLIQGEKSS